MNRSMAIVVVAGSFLFASQDAAAQPEEGHYYRIRNVHSKQVLTVEKEGKEDGADKIVQAVTATNEIQLWKFVKNGDYYNIINIKTGKALNVANESKEKGSPIIQWHAKDNDSENQQWSLEKKGNYFVIKARHSGLALEVAGQSKEVHTPLSQYPFENGNNQLFELVSKRDQLAPLKAMPGGFTKTGTDGKEVVDVANYAVGVISTKEKAMLVKVLQAMSQVVAGVNFGLTLDVRVEEGIRSVYVEVYSGFDGKMELTGWEWASDVRRGKKK